MESQTISKLNIDQMIKDYFYQSNYIDTFVESTINTTKIDEIKELVITHKSFQEVSKLRQHLMIIHLNLNEIKNHLAAKKYEFRKCHHEEYS